MGSSLRYETPITPTTAHTTAASRPHSTSPPPSKKQRMTLTQTYRLAHRARGKLSTEASRGDHDLRLLVGHANLLDGLMVELQDAEREQDAWFEQSVSTPTKPASEPKHVQWSDAITEQHQLDVPDASDSDSDDSEDEEERTPVMKQTAPRRQRAVSPPAKPLSSYAVYDDEDEDDIMADDDESEDLSLALTRTRSHSVHEPECPELVHGDSSDSSDSSEGEDSDDEMAPVETLKPSQSSHDLAAANVIVKDFAAQHQQKQQKQIQEQMEEDGFYLPQQQQQPMVAAC